MNKNEAKTACFTIIIRVFCRFCIGYLVTLPGNVIITDIKLSIFTLS